MYSWQTHCFPFLTFLGSRQSRRTQTHSCVFAQHRRFIRVSEYNSFTAPSEAKPLWLSTNAEIKQSTTDTRTTWCFPKSFTHSSSFLTRKAMFKALDILLFYLYLFMEEMCVFIQQRCIKLIKVFKMFKSLDILLFYFAQQPEGIAAD